MSTMPDLSQRTLAYVMQVLESLTPEDADTFPLRQRFWQQMLFKWGFPKWLIEYSIGTSHNWTATIQDLYGGRVTEIPQILVDQTLKRLAAMAITEAEDSEATSELRRSLQLDGFDVSAGKTVPIEGPQICPSRPILLLTAFEVPRIKRSGFRQRVPSVACAPLHTRYTAQLGVRGVGSSNLPVPTNSLLTGIDRFSVS
jgi:hypothetical protein